MLKFTQSEPTEKSQAVTYSTHYMKHQIIVLHEEKAELIHILCIDKNCKHFPFLHSATNKN